MPYKIRHINAAPVPIRNRTNSHPCKCPEPDRIVVDRLVYEGWQSLTHPVCRCELKAAIIMLTRMGLMPREIADRVGVADTSVYRWRNG